MRARRAGQRVTRMPGRGPRVGAILAAVLLLSAALPSFGQDKPARWICGASLGGLFPSGEFGDRISRMGIGVDVFGGRRIGNAPLFVGVELVAQEIGHALFRTVDSYNSIMQGLVFVRVRPRTGSVVTYIEAAAGLSYVSTETDYGYDDWGDALTEIDSEDLAAAVGIGGGVSFRLGRRGTEGRQPRRGAYLDISARYMTGGRADYLVVLPDGSLQPESSRTRFITVNVGVSYVF